MTKSNPFKSLQKNTVQELEKPIPQFPILIFGAGQFGRDLCKVFQKNGYTVIGFVETNPLNSEILGLPVFDWEKSKKYQGHSVLSLGIFNRDMAMDQLITIAVEAGWKHILMPWQIYDALGGDLGWRFWLGPRKKLVSELDRIAIVSEHLSDNYSKSILYRTCAYRLGYDMEYSSFRSIEPQYFNHLTLSSLSNHDITYVDCGAFNGDTYKELISVVKCSEAYLFEPDPSNYHKLCENVCLLTGHVLCFPLAISNTYAIITLNGNEGESSAISLDGNIHIASATLDEMLGNIDIDFIKIDIEGSEESALLGATKLIERSRPIMAISLYHRQEDLWVIPELLYKLCPDYNFYLRQHFNNSFDLVFYAVPKRTK